MLKGTYCAKATPNSGKIKPVVLAVVEQHFSEGISYPVSWLVTYRSVSRKTKFLKLCSYLMKAI